MKILLITLSNLGDAVMTTPVLERLHQLYPDAVIDIVGDRRSSAVFSCCPYRGRILNKDKRRIGRGVPALLGQLRATRYDLIVDLRTDGLAWLLRARRRLLKWGRRPRGPHAVERHMAVIDAINPGRVMVPPRVRLAPAHREAARALLPAGECYIGLVPGAGSRRKCWPLERYIRLAQRLEDQGRVAVFLPGPRERDLLPRLQRELPGARFPEWEPGHDPLLRGPLLLAALGERLQAAVANDCGAGHLLAAAGTALVSLFGDSDALQYRPFTARLRLLRAAQFGAGERMDAIPVEAVGAALEELLRAGADDGQVESFRDQRHPLNAGEP